MRVETTVEYLDDYDHRGFTIGNGKAKYDFIYVPDGTVGYYYAIAERSYGKYVKRALKPFTKIKVILEDGV